MIGAFSHFWFASNTVFYFRPYQIKGVKKSLFLKSLCFYVLFVVFRLVLQGCGLYYSAAITPLLKIPDKVLFASSVCVQSWVIAKHFFRGNG